MGQLPEILFVAIALEKLKLRLSSGTRRAMTNDDVFDWLLARGFKLGRRGWYVSAALLFRLHPSEVKILERVL